jgi:hypothetical protein
MMMGEKAGEGALCVGKSLGATVMLSGSVSCAKVESPLATGTPSETCKSAFAESSE